LQTNITQYWCGGSSTSSAITGINSSLSGQLPLNGYLLLTISNTQLTGIASSSAGNHTVFFVGTSDGRLKKVCYFPAWPPKNFSIENSISQILDV